MAVDYDSPRHGRMTWSGTPGPRPEEGRQLRATTTAAPSELLRQRSSPSRWDLAQQIRGVKSGSVIRPALHWYPDLGPLLKSECPLTLTESEEALCQSDDQAAKLDGVEKPEKPGSKVSSSTPEFSSVPIAVINLASATMGLGSLSLPRATGGAGVVAALGITCAMFAVSSLSIHLLAASLEAQGADTFAELSVAAGGRRLGIAVEFMCMIYSFGTMVSILLGSAKVVSIAFPEASLSVVVFYVMLAMLPPLLVENVGSLSKISCFSQFCLVYNSCIIVAYVFVLGVHKSVLIPLDSDGSDASGRWNTDLMVLGEAQGAAMGYVRASLVFIFAFANQTVVPCIYAELRERSVHTMTKVGCITMAIVTAIYATVNLAGFFTWGTDCSSNVLFNYRKILGHQAPLCLALASSLVAAWTCFPLNAFPCKFALVALGHHHVPACEGRDSVGWVAAILLVAASYVSAVTLPSLSVVLELVGGTAGVAVMFLLPGGFYLCLVPRSEGELCGPLHMRQLCYLLLACGTVVGTLGTYSALQDAAGLLRPKA